MRKRKHHVDQIDRVEMTTGQYKTLRHLAILWFKVALHHKFRIIKNILFYISIVVAFYYWTTAHGLFLKIEELSAQKTKSSIVEIENVYNVSNYESVISSHKTMEEGFKLLQNRLMKDRSISDDKKYSENGVILKEWRLHCYGQLRKIIFLKTRLSDIERTILYLNYNKTDLIYDIYEKRGYDEALSDLSNYYSKFLTEGQYSYIINGFE